MTLDAAQQRNAELGAQVLHLHDELKLAQLAIDKLKLEVTYLRRMKYGRSSERLEHAQLELVGGEVALPEPPTPAVGKDVCLWTLPTPQLAWRR
jgi:hypothetical protein